MRVLMLGNSFTYFNDMPDTLARLTGAEVTAHTRGGAHLSEQLNPDTEMGARTLRALESEKWDYVVLQEYSNGPITTEAAYRRAVKALSEKARAAGAVPVLYMTWAYQKDGKRLREFGMDYEEMYEKMQRAQEAAAKENGLLRANVGKAFYENADMPGLYDPDDQYHPGEAGSLLAARVLAKVICG